MKIGMWCWLVNFLVFMVVLFVLEKVLFGDGDCFEGVMFFVMGGKLCYVVLMDWEWIEKYFFKVLFEVIVDLGYNLYMEM